MITTQNEFETIPAFEVLAGSSFGTWSLREVAAEMINNVDKTTNVNINGYWSELASATDNDLETMEWVIAECIDDMNIHAPIPESCSVCWHDNEIIVLPYIDPDIPKFEDVPEDHTEDVIYQVNDHGNVTCYQWNPNDVSGNQTGAYNAIWDMV